MQEITVTIKNYDKFKGRKDVAHPNWFKLSNRLLEDPDFYDFTHEEILVWIQILAVSSLKQSGVVTLNLEHLNRVCRLSESGIRSAISKLQAKLILVAEKSKKKPRTQPLRERYARIEEKREEEIREEKRESKPVAVTAPPIGKHLVSHYCDEYKKRYPDNPVIRPQDAKALKSLAESQGESKAMALVSAYLRMNNSWFVTKAHDVTTLVQNLNQVQNFAADGRLVTKTDAQNAETKDSINNQISRLVGKPE